MLVLVPSVLGVTAQVDRPSAEPVISEVTVLQLVRKTARGKKGGIEIEGCGIWGTRLSIGERRFGTASSPPHRDCGTTAPERYGSQPVGLQT